MSLVLKGRSRVKGLTEVDKNDGNNTRILNTYLVMTYHAVIGRNFDGCSFRLRLCFYCGAVRVREVNVINGMCT